MMTSHGAAFRSRAESWAPIAGLLATACVIWSTSIAPFLGRPHLADRIFAAIGIACVALVWSAVVGILLLFLIRRLHRREEAPIIRISAVIWFAPATILLFQVSPLGLVSGLALMVNATRLFCAPSPIRASLAMPIAVGVIGAGELPVGLLSHHFAPALAVAAGFQAASVSFLARHGLTTACLLALSTATLTSVATAVAGSPEDRQPSLPRAVFGLCLTVLLALTLAGVGGGAGWGLGWGQGGSASGQSAVATQTAAQSPRQAADKPDTVGVDAPGDFPGVILWPEVRPATMLIAPALGGGAAMASPARPLTIPFGGEYWMFRWPFRRPPRNSYFQRGTPSTLFFATTDRSPLQMEAHHKLEQALSLRCCSLMQVAILNADRYPGTVSLELVLIDRESPQMTPESLGIKPVTSVPDLNAERPAPVPETLDFSFPSSPGLEQFDEIKVIFYRAGNRMSKSARVSLERFVLVP